MNQTDLEVRRIAVLNTFGVLDTDPEPVYDQITALLAGICDAPIAIISLVDSERQWFKSVYGADWQATSRDIAFCSHAIEQRGLFLVEDAGSDPRFLANPLVCGPVGLRFYAGVPLVSAEGAALGALAVIDRVPRRLTELQRTALVTLAGQVMVQLESTRRQRRLEEALVAREHAQAARRDSEERWRLLFERNPMPMWLFDEQTHRFLAVNDATVLQYGWSPTEFAAMTLFDIRPREDVPILMASLSGPHSASRSETIWRHRTKSGDILHVRITTQTMPYQGREARLVMANDITDQVRATQQLRASETRWQRLFAASSIGIATADLDGRLSSVNPAFCKLTARSEATLLGSAMLAHTHPADVAACQQQLSRLGAGEIHTFSIDKRYLTTDGGVRWARASVTLTPPSEAGQPAQERQYVAVVQDIGAERQAQEDLIRQHSLANMAGRLSRLGGWRVTKPELTVQWTPELRVILEIPHGDIPGVDQGISMYAPDSRERLATALQACLDHGNAFDLELNMRSAMGRPLHVRVMGEAVHDAAGGITGAQGALIDQTERQQTQQALRRSEERFRNVARATADAVWDWDLIAGTVWWNEGIHTLFGHKPQDLLPGNQSWTQLIHPDDHAAITASIHAVIEGVGERWSGEYRFARADGSYAQVLDRAFVIRDDHGRALRMVGGMSDLSAQRVAEHRLRRQAALLDAASDAIVVSDLDHRIVYWSRGAERLFGWDAAQALGRREPELLHEDEHLMADALQQVLAHGAWSAVVQSRCRDGREVQVDLRLSLLRDLAGQPEAVLAIKTDVTEREALQVQLQQSQRLEAVGQLTGGVAHDFNNLLTVILGNAELLAEQLADQPQLLPLAQMTASAAERGAALTQRLLAFARKQPLQPQTVDARQLLAGMDALLRRTLPEDIELELVHAVGLWPLIADPVQLESAVLNLVLNARDAMPQGGKITLETANTWVDQTYAERHADVLPGQYTMLSVSDTGAGMDAHTLARAFEPFFTTKGVGRGTGLGLSMVYGFARQSRGHIKLYSEPGQGTTARLYLPRAEASQAAPEPARPRDADNLRGQGVVLVVEDDDLVRRFAADMLRGLGYEVLAAENGLAALERLRARPDIELLFTDVVMPGGMNGRQLADEALALRPQLKVLFTSGYSENAIVHHGRLDRGVHLLAKPYRAVDLAHKVRSVLAG